MLQSQNLFTSILWSPGLWAQFWSLSKRNMPTWTAGYQQWKHKSVCAHLCVCVCVCVCWGDIERKKWEETWANNFASTHHRPSYTQSSEYLNLRLSLAHLTPAPRCSSHPRHTPPAACSHAHTDGLRQEHTHAHQQLVSFAACVRTFCSVPCFHFMRSGISLEACYWNQYHVAPWKFVWKPTAVPIMSFYSPTYKSIPEGLI